MDSGKWMRLYPIQYRDLDNEKKFSKYSIVEVRCSKPSDDKRPESHHVDADSIKILERWDTKDGWERRKKVVLPTLVKSMCEVQKLSEEKKLSLAVVKPSQVTFECEKATQKDEKEREACYAQLSFYDKKKDAVEQIPYHFYYGFKCADESDCPGHKLSIIDWEIGQAYRDWRFRYKPEELLLEKIKERWLARMCGEKQDTYFFVGNLHRFPKTFMVLGTFYPPKK